MDNLQRLESYVVDEWCKRYMADNNTDYVTAYNVYKHEAKAKRYEQERNARNPEAERQLFIRNYQLQTGSTRQQAIRHVDTHMPQLRNYGANIHFVAALIPNPEGKNNDWIMHSFKEFFQREPERARLCAGDWVSDIATRLVSLRGVVGENKFQSQKISEAIREILNRNPDISEAYASGRMSESAIQTIFHFRFGLPGYDVWANHV